MEIEVKKLDVWKDGFKILENINFQVPSGSSTAIVGISGIGKTTLLQTLAGFLQPKRGEVLLDALSPTSQYKNRRLEFLFQETVVWPHLTVTEALKLTALLRDISLSNAEIFKIIKIVGLVEDKDYYPHQLSVGEKARLAVARAFCTKPELLFMDEPFAAIDSIRRLSLNIKIQEFQEANQCTVVWVTHDIIEAIRFASHIIVLAGCPVTVKKIFINRFKGNIKDSASLPRQALSLRDDILELIKPEGTEK